MTTPALKYSVRDRSILLPYYKRFLVEPLLPFIPSRVNPNAITHGGHVLNLGALLLLVLTANMNKRWPFIATAILVHVYLWCDNADGGHARRTNQCSAKGEFLDHGLDLLNATYVACMTVVTLGAPPFWSVAAAVVVPAAAAVTYWQQAETGVFQLGLFNQIESIFALSVALVARAAFGAEAIASVHVLGISVPVLTLAVVSIVALFGIIRSTMRGAQNRGRLGPAVAPYAFGAAVTVAAALTVTLAAAHHDRGTSFMLVDLQGHVADDVFVDLGLALELGDDRGRSLEVEQNVVRLAVLGDPIGNVAQTPGLGLHDLAAIVLDDLGSGFRKRVDLPLGKVLAREKHMLV